MPQNDKENDFMPDNRRSLTAVSNPAGIHGGLYSRHFWISATLNYLELGDAPVTSPSIPGIGSVTGRFSDRGTIYLRVALNLGGAK